MTTLREQTKENQWVALHNARSIISGMVIAFIFFMCCNSFKTFAQKVSVNVNIELPAWAPYYENVQQVRYYYLPDIESYYDVRNREFIFMDDGEWMFGRTLPPAYRWFNLNNCFIVALDARVVMPWRHFHYYVAHYPRYYYRTIYKDRYWDHNYPLRGFDENDRHEVYNHRNDRENYEVYRKNNSRDASYNRNENRSDNYSRDDYPDRRVDPTQPPEPVIYYGKKVGHPVKVQKNMKNYDDKGEKHEKHGK